MHRRINSEGEHRSGQKKRWCEGLYEKEEGDKRGQTKKNMGEGPLCEVIMEGIGLDGIVV